MLKNTISKKVIYWAEDDIDDMHLFKLFIDEMHPECHVEHFLNGIQLLERLNNLSTEDHPNLIILDRQMPVLDGIETANKIVQQAKYSKVPIVVLSTSLNKKDLAELQQANITAIEKPFSVKESQLVLSEFLSLCRQPDED